MCSLLCRELLAFNSDKGLQYRRRRASPGHRDAGVDTPYKDKFLANQRPHQSCRGLSLDRSFWKRFLSVPISQPWSKRRPQLEMVRGGKSRGGGDVLMYP